MNHSGQSLEFRNLPLIEAVVRVYFRERIQVDFNLVNELHGLLRNDFPNVAPLSVWEVSPALKQETQLPIQRGDLPGAEYNGGSQGLSVHLQPQLLAVRWRRGISEHGPQYQGVRYTKLRNVLEAAFASLGKLRAAGDLQTALANMAYVNFIRIDDPRPYLEEKHRTYATIRAKAVQEQVVAWQAPDGIDLRYEIRGAERTEGTEKSVGFVLTTAAGRKLDTADDPIPTLDAVHAELQVLFADLISDRAKEEWGFQSASTN